MRVLVTGASGFIGRHAVAALQRAGAEVHAVARERAPLDCPWYCMDLLEPANARSVVRQVRPDAVLHLAWCVEHGRFWTDPANADWVGATLVLARAAIEEGVQHFTGVGTCYEYDWPANGDCSEAETPVVGHTLYDIAKTSCRGVLDALFAAHGLDFAWARLFFLYGPDEDARRLVASVAKALVKGEAARCSQGLAVRDFMDVRDAGEALAALTLARLAGAVNVASGEGVRISEVASLLGRLAGRPELIKLGALPDRPDEPRRIVADVTRLREELGFRSRHDLESGLRTALDYWAAQVREGVAG
jgi:nucleoside-diphosphate-sugar epimerase